MGQASSFVQFGKAVRKLRQSRMMTMACWTQRRLRLRRQRQRRQTALMMMWHEAFNAWEFGVGGWVRCRVGGSILVWFSLMPLFLFRWPSHQNSDKSKHEFQVSPAGLAQYPSTSSSCRSQAPRAGLQLADFSEHGLSACRDALVVHVTTQRWSALLVHVATQRRRRPLDAAQPQRQVSICSGGTPNASGAAVATFRI
jgi:hypothetical protein